jgi:hypothetical protein
MNNKFNSVEIIQGMINRRFKLIEEIRSQAWEEPRYLWLLYNADENRKIQNHQTAIRLLKERKKRIEHRKFARQNKNYLLVQILDDLNNARYQCNDLTVEILRARQNVIRLMIELSGKS